MKFEHLRDFLRRAVTFDCETHLIQKGLLAPPLVCASIAMATFQRDSAGRETFKIESELLRGPGTGDATHEPARRAWWAIVTDPSRILVGANIAYDNLVLTVEIARAWGYDCMPEVFAMYEAERVFDIQTQFMLHQIGTGWLGKDPRTGGALKDPITHKQARCNLGIVTEQVRGRVDAKINARFRDNYYELDSQPVEQWPWEGKQYPVDDSVNTHEDALGQVGVLPSVWQHDWDGPTCRRCGYDYARDEGGKSYDSKCWATIPHRNLHDLAAQVYTAWCMHLNSSWGLRVDRLAIEELQAKLDANRPERAAPYYEAGVLRIKREKGEEREAVVEAEVKKRVAIAFGANAPCPICRGSGRVPSPSNPKTQIICYRPGDLGEDGKPEKLKTCDGSGYLLEGTIVPRTASGEISMKRDTLMESGDEFLMTFAAYEQDAKIGNVYLPWLREGLDYNGPCATCGAVAAEHAPTSLARLHGYRVCEQFIPRQIPLTLRPNVLLETGRTSYDGVVQLLPREGGVRECVIPSAGWVFYSVDYGGIELATHAQNCLWLVGHSRMAEALNRGIDLHGALGATMSGQPYEEFAKWIKDGDKAAKSYRQAAKPANFGFPGGMSAIKLVHQQREQGPDTEWPNGPAQLKGGKRGYKGLRFCLLIGGRPRCGEEMVVEWRRRPISPTCKACIECAEKIRDAWFKQWPENIDYLGQGGRRGKIAEILDEGMRVPSQHGNLQQVYEWDPHTGSWQPLSHVAPGAVIQHVSRRIRAFRDPDEAYCSAANGFFQGLASDGAKAALRRVTREQYDRTARLPDGSMSPLFGSRGIVFAHDELIGECPEPVGHEVCERVVEVMVTEMKRFVPDVRVTAEPTLMRRWFKSAAPRWRDGGSERKGPSDRLVAWEPKQ